MEAPGDRQEFDRQVLDLLPEAMRFAIRLTGCADRAEDLLQTALVRVARSWQSFRGDARLRSWFFRIVINVFRDSLAARNATEHLPDEVCDGRQETSVDAVIHAELEEIVARKVSALPPRQREVLVLITYEQLSPAEVAAMLGITTANVHSTLHVARERLREQLAPYLSPK